MPRGRIRFAWIAATTVIAAACGSGATNPDQFNLVLTPGQYFFATTILSVPPNCGPGFTTLDVAMASRVTLAKDGSDWVARSATPADGTLEIRFRGSAGPIINSAAPVGGTIRGIANHRDNATTSIQRSMTIPLTGESATIQASANDAGEFPLLSTSTFGLTFTRTAGGSSVSCQLAVNLWVLRRD